MLDQIPFLLADRHVQWLLLGIGALITLNMTYNFVINLLLIRFGLYKRVSPGGVDWGAAKGGIIVIALGVLAYYWLTGAIGFWLGMLFFLIVIGAVEVLSGLFGRRAWVHWKRWT